MESVKKYYLGKGSEVDEGKVPHCVGCGVLPTPMTGMANDP